MSVFDVLAKLPADQLARITDSVDEKFSALGETMIVQAGVNVVRDEYEALGMDTEQLQNNYILTAGVWMIGLTLLSGIATIIVGYLSAKFVILRILQLDKRRSAMFKKLSLIFISFFLLLNVLYAQTNEDQLIDEMVCQVDTEELRLRVEQLSGAMPLDDGSLIDTRRAGTEGNKKAADYIAEQYSNIENLDIQIDRFNAQRIARVEKLLFKLIAAPDLDEGIVEAQLEYFDMTMNFLRKNNMRRSENILAILRGESKEFVFTTAHYDSCAVGPDYERPAVPVPQRFDSAPAAEGGSTDAAWWRAFEDPVVTSLVEEALGSNRDLVAATARVEQAAAVLTSARAPLFPQVGYETSGTRQQPAGGPPRPDPTTTYVGLATAAWEIHLWGRIRRQTESAQANLLATEEARRGDILTLVGQVANNYLTLRALDEQLAVAHKTLVTYNESLKLFELQFKYGVVSQMNVAQAKSQSQTAAAQIPAIQQQIVQLGRRVIVLLDTGLVCHVFRQAVSHKPGFSSAMLLDGSLRAW